MSTLLTITEACKQFKINRTTMYRYIKTGVISVSKNEKNKTVIDRTEIMRVFPETSQNVSNVQSGTSKNDKNDAILLQKIHHLEEKLRDKDELILSLNEHIDTLKQSLFLINHKVENVSKCADETEGETKSKKSWKFWKRD